MRPGTGWARPGPAIELWGPKRGGRCQPGRAKVPSGLSLAARTAGAPGQRTQREPEISGPPLERVSEPACGIEPAAYAHRLSIGKTRTTPAAETADGRPAIWCFKLVFYK